MPPQSTFGSDLPRVAVELQRADAQSLEMCLLGCRRAGLRTRLPGQVGDDRPGQRSVF